MKEFLVAGRPRITVLSPQKDKFGSNDHSAEVSWSAIGAVNVGTAREFMNALSEAIAYAKSLDEAFEAQEQQERIAKIKAL